MLQTAAPPWWIINENMAHKQQYESLPGRDSSEKDMSGAKGDPVVLSQPTKLSATEEYVLNLDPNTVAGRPGEMLRLSFYVENMYAVLNAFIWTFK